MCKKRVKKRLRTFKSVGSGKQREDRISNGMHYQDKLKGGIEGGDFINYLQEAKEPAITIRRKRFKTEGDYSHHLQSKSGG